MKNKEKDGFPSLPVEFTERLSRLLLSFINGLSKSVPDDDKLRQQLNAMAGVIRKGVRITPYLVKV